MSNGFIQLTTGPAGAQGAPGPQGSPGTQGSQGLAGNQGSQGAPGPQGLGGPQGYQGFPGYTGPTGPQGSQGIDGRAIFTGTAGESLSQFDLVYLNADGKWYKAKADAETTASSYGLVTQSGGISLNGSGTISGPGMLTGMSGLTPGAIYYLSNATAGAWTTAAPVIGSWEVCLGIALSSSTFLFEPGYIAFQRTEDLDNTVMGTAGEVLAEFQVVYSDPADSGKYKKAKNNGTARQASAVGLVVEVGGIGNGSVGRIRTLGKISNGSWSWTPGDDLYLDSTSGGLIATKPSTIGEYVTHLGYAISATDIWLFPVPSSQIISSLGPTGPTGPQGSLGQTGPTGPQGPTADNSNYFLVDGSRALAGHLLPDMTGASGDVSVRDIGSATQKFNNIYAHDVHVDAGSLYVNDKKVIEDVSDTITIRTDADQDLAIKTTGSGDINLLAEHTVSARGDGGIEINVPSTHVGKNLSLSNESTSGSLSVSSSGVLGDVDIVATNTLGVVAELVDMFADLEVTGAVSSTDGYQINVTTAPGPASECIKLYATGSGVSPNRTISLVAKFPDGTEVIFASRVI
jgi:hypothetical protein